ncbi:MAG: MMPL family transporter, partial [bacterium]
MAKLKYRIETGFARFGRMVYRNPWKTLALMVVLAAALVYQLPSLTQDTSPESFFHKDDPNLIQYNAFREQFGRDEMVIAVLRPKEVFEAGFLSKLEAFHEALEKEVPHLKEVTSLINIRNTHGRGDELVVEELVKEIPSTPGQMAALKARVMASRLYPNLYISEDGRTTVVILETIAQSPGGKGGKDDLVGGFSDEEDGKPESQEFVPLTQKENRAVVRAVEKVAGDFRGPDFPVQLTGQPVISEFFNAAIGRDVGTFMTLAFISFTIFLLFLFRRISGALMPLMIVVLSMLSAIGLMALVGAPFTSVTSILPSFMMSVGIGSSVHILVIFYRRFQQTGDKEEAIVYTFGHSGLPVVMTALTTVAGLLSFATARMAPVADLGLFGGFGVILVLIFTLALMPALISLLPLKPKSRFGGQNPGRRVDRILTAIAAFSTRRAWSIVAVSAIVLGAAGSGLFFQGFGHHFIAWIPKGTPVRDAVVTIDRELKGMPTIEVVLDTGKENGLYNPKLMKRIAELNKFAEDFRDENGLPVVGKTT